MNGKALRRALAADPLRVGAEVPLITDTTEMITPTVAQEMLKNNRNNRPINWRRVEEYASVMKAGEWQLHSQGIVLDVDGNILTGQKRLWAVIASGVNVYMRVSRGNPRSTARLLDRGTPQTARDLASRDTGRKHSPTEASIARAYCALMGNSKPDTDVLSEVIAVEAVGLAELVRGLRQTKKTKAVLMIAGALLESNRDIRAFVDRVPLWADELVMALLPHTPEACWNKGAAFGLAMTTAKRIVAGTS